MLKHILATSALATLLATGLQAQTAADPAAGADTTAPMEGAETGQTTMPAEGAAGAETTAPVTGATPGATPGASDSDMAAPAPENGDAAIDAARDAATDGSEAETAAPAEGTMGGGETETAAPATGGAEDPAASTAAPAEGTMGGGETETAAPAAGSMEDPAASGEMAPVDLSTMSSEDLIGTDIVNYNDETIAAIEDVIITDDGQVESLVARFGGFLGFGSNRVLLTMEEVEVMQDANQEVVVRTNLTPENIEERPAYEEEAEG